MTEEVARQWSDDEIVEKLAGVCVDKSAAQALQMMAELLISIDERLQDIEDALEEAEGDEDPLEEEEQDTA